MELLHQRESLHHQLQLLLHRLSHVQESYPLTHQFAMEEVDAFLTTHAPVIPDTLVPIVNMYLVSVMLQTMLPFALEEVLVSM